MAKSIALSECSLIPTLTLAAHSCLHAALAVEDLSVEDPSGPSVFWSLLPPAREHTPTHLKEESSPLLVPSSIPFFMHVLPACMSAPHSHLLRADSRGDIGSFRTGVIDCCEHPCGCWELNTGPFQRTRAATGHKY